MRTSVNYAVVPYIMKWLAEATAILHITLLIRIAVNIMQNNVKAISCSLFQNYNHDVINCKYVVIQ